MLCTLPPEILDHIVDHLHNETATLRACCVVSKSWIPRARKHLFARVEFHTEPWKSPIELWKKTFPDPSNSPGHHTRNLSIYRAYANTGVGGWIRAFHNVVHLRLEALGEDPRSSIAPFYDISPTLRSLHLASTSLEVFDFICSFPLLEDLALDIHFPGTEVDGWITPLTSPKLTGFLHLGTEWEIRPAVRRLCALPGGLRFTEIALVFLNWDAKSIIDLVSRCSDTLESLSIGWFSPPGTFPLASVTFHYLTIVHGCRPV